ncbi:MAG: hypothetical protein ACK56N_01235 [Betaproteobacteria bacterium]
MSLAAVLPAAALPEPELPPRRKSRVISDSIASILAAVSRASERASCLSGTAGTGRITVVRGADVVFWNPDDVVAAPDRVVVATSLSRPLLRSFLKNEKTTRTLVDQCRIETQAPVRHPPNQTRPRVRSRHRSGLPTESLPGHRHPVASV